MTLKDIGEDDEAMEAAETAMLMLAKKHWANEGRIIWEGMQREAKVDK
jgi:hypothetical protein